MNLFQMSDFIRGIFSSSSSSSPFSRYQSQIKFPLIPLDLCFHLFICMQHYSSGRCRGYNCSSADSPRQTLFLTIHSQPPCFDTAWKMASFELTSLIPVKVYGNIPRVRPVK